MKKMILFLIFGLGVGCAQADQDQYKALGPQPVYGESNGVYYDATNDYLSFFINDTEVLYVDSSGNVTADGTITEGAQALEDDTSTTYGTGSDSIIQYAASAQAPDSLFVGVGTDSRQLIIAETADVSTDLTIAQQTNPTINVHSADATDAADYITIAHDQSNGVIDVGQGSVYLGSTVVCENNTTVGAGGAGVDYTFGFNGETSDFLMTWMEDEDQLKIADDLDLDGGAGAIDFSSDGASSILVADNDTTALIIGSSSDTGILTIDTGDDAETVVVNGYAAATALHVNVGTTLLDEDLTIGDNTNGVDYKITFDGNASDGVITWMEDETRIDVESNLEFGAGAAGVDYTLTANGETADGTITWMEDESQWKFTNDIDLDGGAGCIDTTTSGDSTMLVTDADSTAFCIGATGALDLVCIDSTDASPALDVKGVTTQVALHVDVGTAQFDESPTIGAAAAGVDYTLTFNGETADCALTCMEDETRLDVESHLQFGAGAAGVDYTLTADGEDNDGTITWMEDEIQWKFANAIDADGDVSLGGGVGALTFDAASSSLVCTDNSSTGLVMGATGATTMITLDTTDDAENVKFGNGIVVATTSNTAASNVTLDGSDCGKVHFMGSGMDGNSFLLPATIAGCRLEFVYVGADHGALLDLSPNASDAIHGTCVEMTGDTAVEFSGADDADIGCTKGTCNTGDGITLIGDGGEGWYVTSCNGIWANN